LVPYGAVDRQSTFFLSYELQNGAFKGLGASATLVSVGRRSASDSSVAATYGNGTNAVFVKGYERVDLNFFYKGLPNWDFSLQVRNLFDEVYIERFRGLSGSNYWGSPRAFLFRAQHRFAPTPNVVKTAAR
jgi:outer membrane receptor protein involved in Fe transport